MKPLYLTQDFGLSFTAPAAAPAPASFDEYVSDPAKPVPYVPRPVRFADGDTLAQVAGDRPARRSPIAPTSSSTRRRC